MGNMLRRFVLFGLVNVFVVVSISLVLNLLGVRPYLTARGIDYNSLLVFCLVWGMGGAFISLALSRIMAKTLMGVQVIDPNTRDSQEQELVQMVYGLARGAGLSTMPEVGIYASPEINAFATGPTRSRALVAVSSGLLSRMRTHEVQGVLGHEVSHIANGDMVTMTLVQGVVNAFVMFLARIFAFFLDQALRGSSSSREESRGPSIVYYISQIFFEIMFALLGTLVVAMFSRWREYRADSGGARLAGRDNMISALQALQRTLDLSDVGTNQPATVQSLKISSRRGGFLSFFATHPPLEDRIARLERMTD